MDVSEQESAVAVGAVLRALDKENGPQRITKSSYGFLRTEPYEPHTWEAHAETKPTIDQNDGEKYVKTIYWLICKNEPVPFHEEYSIIVIHTIPTNRKSLLCEELLYVSDTSTESHYRRDHAKNKGCEIAGRIVADMSFLRDKHIIQPIERGRTWKRHYRIEYQLVMIVDGRNLRYEARWPVGGTIRGRGQTSIAAAFKPGTK
ncbi:hypothetical protein LAWI1_G001604 [Lachnellula willkommii]|uniref:Uncharacterized protein n=1 Tax=Lachnellula willkommii TaxID=215461 RepID=A0A559MJW1_9HELO|nr:hypothetical protein LAWI1_G001604 [Lachnellula willkommii]